MATQPTIAAGGELGEGVVAGRVERVAMVPQLDEHPVAPEGLDEPVQLPPGRRRTVVDQRRAARAPLRHPVSTHTWPGRVAGDVGQRELRRPLLPGQVAEAQGAGEPGVALRPVGQQQQVRAVRIRGVRSGTRPVATWVSVSASHAPPLLGVSPGVSVISAPNTVGSPTARAASAKRTTP